MGALAPLIVSSRVQEADLHRVVEDLRLPARFFAEVIGHLDAAGVAVVDGDDTPDDAGFDRDGLSVFFERAAAHRILTADEERGLARIIAEGRSILGELSDRDRRVIELRFGLADGRIHTLEEIGQMFSLTRERIRQIEVKSLKTLRFPAKSHGLDDFIDQEREA